MIHQNQTDRHYQETAAQYEHVCVCVCTCIHMDISIKYFIKQYLESTSTEKLYHDQAELIPGIQDCFNFENQSVQSIILINHNKSNHFTKCR